MDNKKDVKSEDLYFRASEEEVVESEEIESGVVLDYDKDGKIVGIEVLDIGDKSSVNELVEYLASKSELREEDVEEMSEELKERIAEHYY